MGTENRPEFRYQPNLYENDDIVMEEGVCECCGKAVDMYVDHMYGMRDVNCVCLDCVADGSAAEKFHGEFIQEVEEEVGDEETTHELTCCTPGYNSWQGEYWLTCCNDYCAYIGRVGTEELEEMDIADEVFAEYEERGEYEDVREVLERDGSVQGYLFQCLHCGQYHLWVDTD